MITAGCLLALLLAPQAAPEPPKLRLPDGARPLKYAVDLTVLPEGEELSGSIEIDLRIERETSLLWLNATDLTLSHAELTVSGRTLPARVVPGGEDYAGFAFDRPVTPGPARLRIAFVGRINTKDTSGVFRQKVGDHWYAFTQFQAIDARRAFPCFDEPAYKVPWRLTLRVKQENRAVSNAPMLREKPLPGGQKAVTFAETKPLPSYLVAFGVGPFDIVDAGRAGAKPTPIRMIVPQGRAAEARHAAATAGPILVELEKYFGTPFPFEKLDNLVIPQTVRFSAMENAGLVTYNEGVLLARPEQETPAFQRRWASIYAHETAHQWFGDLVTLAWWDDTWLNESFATWMASRILEEWKPGWAEEVERVKDRSAALEDDSLGTARAIRLAIESKDDIDNAFDNISYGKGAAVIGMFEGWMGREAFRAGVRRYLAAHAWGSATEKDFRAALAAEGGAGIAEAFSTFLDRPGFPLITARLVCSDGPPRLSLTQERFRAVGSPETPPTLWKVPVRVRYESGGGGALSGRLLEDAATEIPLSEAKACPGWVMANAGGAGYYRVVYEAGLSKKLYGPALTVPEKVALVRDLGTLAVAGRVPFAEALALVPEVARENDRQLLAAGLRIVKDVDEAVLEGLRPRYARFVQAVFGERARALGWNPRTGEDENAQLLRPTLVSLVARGGEDETLRAEARALAGRWLDDRRAVWVESVGAVLGIAAEDGDRALFERFKAEVRRATERRDRNRLFEALGQFRDPAVLKDAFSLVLAPELDVRESAGILWAAFGDRDNRGAAWDFFRANFDPLVARLPREAGAFLPFAGAGFCDSTRRAEVEAFFGNRVEKLIGARRNLAHVLERIDLCQAAAVVQRPSIVEFLKER